MSLAQFLFYVNIYISAFFQLQFNGFGFGPFDLTLVTFSLQGYLRLGTLRLAGKVTAESLPSTHTTSLRAPNKVAVLPPFASSMSGSRIHL